MKDLDLFIFAEGDSSAQIQLLPETPEIVFGLLAFAIVLAFFNYFVFPKFNEVVAARAASIEGKIIEADQALAKAQETQQTYEAKLVAVGEEANSILETARQDADTMRHQIVSTAKTEAEQIKADAEHAAAEQKNQVLVEATDQVASLSVEIASHIVAKEIDEARHHELVNEFIDGLKQ